MGNAKDRSVHPDELRSKTAAPHFAIAHPAPRRLEEEMDAPQVSAPVEHTPIEDVRAQARAAFQLFIKPHTMPFHLAALVVSGLITVVFLVITLLMIMVATNFNVLDWIE